MRDPLVTFYNHNVPCRSLIGSLHYSDDRYKADRERAFIRELCKLAERGDTVIHALHTPESDEILGLVAFSASRVDEIPCLEIKYLFVDRRYRQKIFKDLHNKKISQLLIEHAIKTAQTLKNNWLGIRYLILMTDNDHLQPFYESYGFRPIHSMPAWMFLKV